MRSTAIFVSVCLSACSHTSKMTRPNFAKSFAPVAVARYSLTTMWCHILSVLWMTSCFHIIAQIQIVRYRPLANYILWLARWRRVRSLLSAIALLSSVIFVHYLHETCCQFCPEHIIHELIRRWDSGRELLHSAPRKLPEFAEITQNNGHYAFQGHSRSPILVPIESLLYDFILMLNSNLPHILHRFRDIAVDRSEIAIFGYPSCV